MKIIMGGHWAPAPNGWLALKEKDQDITKRLNYEDASVDVIFTEHVIEHVSLEGGVHFMKEALRVLKPGGIFRVVAPMIDRLIKFEGGEPGRRYAVSSLVPWFRAEEAFLKSLGLSIEFDPHPFLLDSLLKKHSHKFVWSVKLMTEVLTRLGYSDVYESFPGQSQLDPTTAIERKIRGTHAENLTRDFGITMYDPESCVVEARK